MYSNFEVRLQSDPCLRIGTEGEEDSEEGYLNQETNNLKQVRRLY